MLLVAIEAQSTIATNHQKQAIKKGSDRPPVISHGDLCQ
jgi:hypothetical protein